MERCEMIFNDIQSFSSTKFHNSSSTTILDEENTSVTFDLGFAAFLISVKHYELLIPPYVNPKGNYIFKFAIKPEHFQELQNEYSNSPFKNFDAALKGLKRKINAAKKTNSYNRRRRMRYGYNKSDN